MAESSIPNVPDPVLSTPAPAASKMTFIILCVILVLLLAGVVFLAALLVQKSRVAVPAQVMNSGTPTASPSAVPRAGNFTVLYKDTNTPGTYDLYLQNMLSKDETFFMTVSEVNTRHYHAAEYHNGNVYVIHRSGGDNGFETDPNWTEWLSRYDTQRSETKLFTARGLDFRVSDDERIITVLSDDKLNILNTKGAILYTASTKNDEELQPTIEGVTSSSLWMSYSAGPMIKSLMHVKIPDYETKTYDLASLKLGSEYDFNPATGKIVYSTFPIMFDASEGEKFQESKTKVELYVYDIMTDAKKNIITSEAKSFQPVWKDESTIEYTDPSSGRRVTRRV